MKKILQWMFLLVLVGAMGTIKAQSFNYSCGFETVSERNGWTLDHAGCYESYWYMGSSVSNTGSKSLYVTSDDNVGAYTYKETAESCAYAYHDMDMSAGDYHISFDWKCKGEELYDYFRVFIIPSSTDLIEFPSYNFFDGLVFYPSVKVDGGRGLYDSGSGWTQLDMDFEIETAGSYRLIFYWINDGFHNFNNDNKPAAIDNISIFKYNCPKVMNLLTLDVTDNSLTIGWDDNDEVASWKVEYAAVGDEDHVMERTVTSPQCELTSLLSSTFYEISVSSVCSDGVMSMPKKTIISTGCGIKSMPYFTGFESDDTYSTPMCWNVVRGEIEVYNNYSIGHYSKPYSGENFMYINGGSVVTTPMFRIPEHDFVISFMGHQSVYHLDKNWVGDLEIGFVSNLNDWDDYVALEVVPSCWYQYMPYSVKIDAGEIVADSGYFVFSIKQSEVNGYWTIDDVKIAETGSCEPPTNFHYSNLDAAALTADFTWSGPTTGVKYQIDENGWISDVENDTTIVGIGMRGGTNFINMRMIRGNDTSAWRFMGSVYVETNFLNNVDIQYFEPNSAIVRWTNSPLYAIESASINMSPYNGGSQCGYYDIMDNYYVLRNLDENGAYKMILNYSVNGRTAGWEHVVDVKAEHGMYGNDILSDDYYGEYFPVNVESKYSCTEVIYAAENLRCMEHINGIAYHYINHSYFKDTVNGEVKIYIGNTDKNRFKGNDNFIPREDLTLVYDGQMLAPANECDTMMFNTPFTNDGRNVVVMVVYESNHNYQGHFEMTRDEKRGLYSYSDMSEEELFENSGNTIDRIPFTWFVGDSVAATCLAPIVGCKTAEADSLVICWIPRTEEGAWKVEYREYGSDEWTLHTANTTDTFAVIRGLKSGAEYEVRVGSLCSDKTVYTTITCVTKCGGLLEVPYRHDFATKTINGCWIVDYSVKQSENIKYDKESIVLPMGTTMVLPKFAADIDALKMKVKVGEKSVGIPIYVGFCADQNVDNFVPYDTISCNELNREGGVTVNFDEYVGGENDYIALRCEDMLYLSSVEVDSMGVCPDVKDIKLKRLSSDEFELTWSNEGEANAWSVTVEGGGTSTTVECDTNSATVTGLLADFEYEVEVASMCGNDVMGEVSKVKIKTLTDDPIELPYYTTFHNEQQNAQWQQHNFMGDCSWGFVILQNDEHEKCMGVMYEDECGFDKDNKCRVMTYIPIRVPEDGMYDVSYVWSSDAKVYNIAETDYCRAILIPIEYNFSKKMMENVTMNNLLNDWIAIDKGAMNNNKKWEENSMSVYVEAGDYYLAFVWYNFETDEHDNYSYTPTMIDNLSIKQQSCVNPYRISVEEVTSNSATIVWRADDAESWEVSVVDGETMVVNEPRCTINNLNPAMLYTVKVRSICTENDKSRGGEIKFMTDCGEIDRLPYVNDFNGLYDASYVYCWRPLAGDYSYSNYEMFMRSQDDEYNYVDAAIAMPRISESISINSLTLSLKVRNTSEETVPEFIVGMCTDNDLSTFVGIDTLQLTEGVNQCEIPFEGYTGTGRNITFMLKSNDVRRIVAFDHLVLKEKTACDEPVMVTVNDVDAHSFVVNWNQIEGQSLWEVQVANYYNYSETFEVSTNSCTVNNLRSGCDYMVKVRAKCGESDLKVWSEPISVRTDCETVSDITVDNIGKTMATITMNDAEHYFWKIYYSDQSSDFSSLGDKMVVTTEEPMVTLYELTPGTTYYFVVSAMCIEGTESSLSEVKSFTTLNQDNPEGIDGVESNWQLSVYPNPTSGSFVVKLNGVEGRVEISVVDMNGRMISNEMMECNSDCEKRMDVQNLAQGTYFIHVIGDEMNSVRKLIVR